MLQLSLYWPGRCTRPDRRPDQRTCSLKTNKQTVSFELDNIAKAVECCWTNNLQMWEFTETSKLKIQFKTAHLSHLFGKP